jgi:hypothetical protein
MLTKHVCLIQSENRKNYRLSQAVVFLVLVQKLQNTCNESLNLEHTDTITLKKGHDKYGKPKFVQMEALSA